MLNTKLKQPSSILNVLIHTKNKGKSDHWVDFLRRALQYIERQADLKNPQQVEQYIANLPNKNSWKAGLCQAYKTYCKYYKIQWEKPYYKTRQTYRKPPTTKQVETIINYSRIPLKTKLTIVKETGLRPTELIHLTPQNIDLENKKIYPATAKGGSPRILPISKQLKSLITHHIKKYKIQQNQRLFGGTTNQLTKSWIRLRKNTAKKLQDQSLNQIRLYDLRHYFATQLYAKTRDIIYVKQQLGHKAIQTTMTYVHLINENDTEEHYNCKTATTINEATKLIENGFEYVTELDNIKIFRKRK